MAFLCPPRAPPPQRPCVVPRLSLSLCAAVAAPAPPPLRPERERGTADKGEERQTQSLAKTEVKTAARQSQRQKSHPPCHMPDCSDRAPPHNCSLLRTTWNVLSKSGAVAGCLVAFRDVEILRTYSTREATCIHCKHTALIQQIASTVRKANVRTRANLWQTLLVPVRTR